MADLVFLQSEEAKQFIAGHQHSDINSMLLNPPKEFSESIRILADQILSRRKAKGKLNSWLQNPDIIFPAPLSVEQSSSEATATYKQSLIGAGKHLVDLTGGMGVDCIALSDGFKETT